MSYTLTWERHGVIKRHFDAVTGSELIAAVEATEADARFDTYRYVINDFLDCSSITFTEDEIALIAAIDRAAALTNRHIKVAIVATHPDVHAIARQYAEDPNCPYATALFTSLGEARSWIGRDACQTASPADTTA